MKKALLVIDMQEACLALFPIGKKRSGSLVKHLIISRNTQYVIS